MVRDAFALHKIVIPLPRQDVTVVTLAQPTTDVNTAQKRPTIAVSG